MSRRGGEIENGQQLILRRTYLPLLDGADEQREEKIFFWSWFTGYVLLKIREREIKRGGVG